MFPEVAFQCEGQTFRVWATGPNHLGFDAGFERGREDKQQWPPIVVNGVRYNVRFDAECTVDGKWQVQADRREVAGKTWTYYGGTVYIYRSDWPRFGAGGIGQREPTEKGKQAIWAMTERVLAAFLQSEQAAGLLASGERERVRMDLEAADRKRKETGEAHRQAMDEWVALRIQAARLGLLDTQS